MSSLTAKLRAKKALDKKRGNNIAPLVKQQGIKLVVEDSKSLGAEEEVLSSIDDCDVYNFDHTMFISDREMSKEIRDKLDDFPKIKIWSEQFINRDCKQLAEKGVKSMWISLSNKKSREWLQLNLKKTAPYTTVLVWNGSKSQKYLADLSDKIDIKIRGIDLNRLKSLSFSDLLMQSLQYSRIHAPGNKLDTLLSCLGCSSNLKRSKSGNA